MSVETDFHTYLWVKNHLENKIDLTKPVNALSITSARFINEARKLKDSKMKTRKINNPNCKTCGRFMKRIGLISRIRLEVECGIIRTHLCVKEEIIFSTGECNHL